ncbi:MAG: hypothetical protein ACRDGT_09795 [Candidatus Limnocylindria bacterium]
MRTFVVRIWEGAGGGPAADPSALRGVLEEVETGEATRFTRGEELLGALERAAQRDGGPAANTSTSEGPEQAR